MQRTVCSFFAVGVCYARDGVTGRRCAQQLVLGGGRLGTLRLRPRIYAHEWLLMGRASSLHCVQGIVCDP